MLSRNLAGSVISALGAGGSPAPVPTAAPAAGGVRRGSRTLEELARQRRLAFPQPVRGGPLAVDLIRADRDSR